MNILGSALIAILFSSTAAIAAPASERSIKQLLVVTQAQKVLHRMRGQVESFMNASIQQALNGKTPTAGQQQAIANLKSRMITLIQSELAWEKLQAIYVRLYKESFSEEEVAGMLSFYKTPAGQAVIHKMPAVTQKIMLEFQETFSGVNPKMKKIQQDFLAEMQAASK